jgi:hypothetical protein
MMCCCRCMEHIDRGGRKDREGLFNTFMDFSIYSLSLSPPKWYILFHNSLFLSHMIHIGTTEHICTCWQIIPWSTSICRRWISNIMEFGSQYGPGHAKGEWYCTDSPYWCELGWDGIIRLASHDGSTYIIQGCRIDKVAIKVHTK